MFLIGDISNGNRKLVLTYVVMRPHKKSDDRGGNGKTQIFGRRNLKTIDAADFDQYVALFERHFDLHGRIPEFVFRRRNTHKLVIWDSSGLHIMEVFERLGAAYDDRELNSLIIAPEAANVFHTANRLLAYILPFGPDFRKSWQVDLRGLGDDPDKPNNIWPWMTASLQCYIGSSEAWCSYHDRHAFEMDMFYVPNDCDTLGVFGKAGWTFEDAEVVLTSFLKTPKHELQKLKENYFK